ncbi:MAG: hypothetical protein ACREQH_07820, partial [Candidatus Binatus sp.]
MSTETITGRTFRFALITIAALALSTGPALGDPPKSDSSHEATDAKSVLEQPTKDESSAERSAKAEQAKAEAAAAAQE